MAQAFRITFKFSGSDDILAQASGDETLLSVAKRAHVAMDAPCAGNGTCGKCKLRVLSGEALGGLGRHVGAAEAAEGVRLACECRAASDLALFVPDASLAYQSRLRVTDLAGSRERGAFEAYRARLLGLGYAPDSGLSLVRARMGAPTLDDPAADRERLLGALGRALGAAPQGVRLSLAAQARLPGALRAAGFDVRCAVRSEPGAGAVGAARSEPGAGAAAGAVRAELGAGAARAAGAPPYTVLDVLPGSGAGAGAAGPALAGLALDIGTTTVSALLVDLETGEPVASGSAGNGQVRYGADVINRIVESARPGGLERLRSAVADDCVAPLVAGLCRAAGVPPGRVLRVAAAGNTTMTHLFLGVDAAHIRLEPYVPAFFALDGVRGGDLGIGVHPDAEVVLAPCIGSYVGGDITAGVFAAMLAREPGCSVFLDLGTNGEIVFCGEGFQMACACSAGPAFEGGDISCGMRAAEGAIEKVRIDPITLEPAFAVIGAGGVGGAGAAGDAGGVGGVGGAGAAGGAGGALPAGLCGSGLIDAVAGLFAAGAINAKGRFVREGARVTRDEAGTASYVLAWARDTAHGQDIALTEVDIDNFIRAKGSIFSALRSMLAAAGFPAGALGRVLIAGGIGSGIDIGNAIRVGMLPDLPRDRFRYVGNASLMGAYGMLTSRAAAGEVARVAGGMTYLEMSAHPGYMDEFVAACFLPHTDATLFPSPVAAAR